MGTTPASNYVTPAGVKGLPPALREVIVSSYNDALTPVFLYMMPLAIAGLVLLAFVIEKPLATTIERDILPESLEIDGGNWELLDRRGTRRPSPLERKPARARTAPQ